MKILIFSFTFIGDAVLSTAVIQPLRRRFSDAHITFLVGPRAAALFTTEPQIDAVHIYDNRGEHAGWKGRLRLIKTLRREKFDIVVNLRDSLVARFIGAEHWGMGRSGGNRHAVTRYLEVLERQDVDTTDAHPHLQLTEKEQAEARRFLVGEPSRSRHLPVGEPSRTQNTLVETFQSRFCIGMHPGGNWIYKLWDAQKYAQLATTLYEKLGATIILFAGPDERELQAQVASLIEPSPLLIKTGNLRHLAAFIAACDVYIGNDTGPMHIAAAVDTPVVALFGSTNHHRSGPYGEKHTVVQSGLQLGCNPCHPGRNPGGCGAGSCAVIDGITVAQVVEAVEGYLP